MGCSHCTSIKGPTVLHPSNGYSIPVHGYFTCDCEGVIYLPKCPCGKGYVGQTSRAIKKLLNEHKSNIRTYHNKIITDSKQQKEESKKFGQSTVAKHYTEHRHNTSDVRWLILEQLTHRDEYSMRRELLKRESYWINKLGTLAPGGLNESLNLILGIQDI